MKSRFAYNHKFLDVPMVFLSALGLRRNHPSLKEVTHHEETHLPGTRPAAAAHRTVRDRLEGGRTDLTRGMWIRETQHLNIFPAECAALP
jgi:hypothetical protein